VLLTKLNNKDQLTDAITGKTVNNSQLKLPTKGGRWLRAEK
jgi:hypothetical protein